MGKRSAGSVILSGALLLLLGGCGRADSGPEAGEPRTVGKNEQRPEPPQKTQPPEVVVFIVVDAVRSYHLSLCGYSRPTSGAMDRLVELGARWTCRAYAPGAWTLPSHASFFTGAEVPAHGAENYLDAKTRKGALVWQGNPLLPLGPKLPTLAEKMRDRGFTTAFVSGNPVVSKWSKSGLVRGFDHVEETRAFGALYGERLVDAVSAVLSRAVLPGKPLFLFVNIADAHTPWSAVPKGLAWLPPRPGLDVGLWKPDNPFVRFMRKEMARAQARKFAEHARDAYDYAVFRADKTLGRTVDLLFSRGLLGPEARLIVTSDHGEFLGERDLMHHFTFVYEPNANVPFVYWSKDDKAPARLPEPFAALNAYDLALTGKLPKKPRPVRAMGQPSALMVDRIGKRVKKTTAALWTAKEKLLWIEGEYFNVHLKTDPKETNLEKLGSKHPLRPKFEAFIQDIGKMNRQVPKPSKELEEALEELGYAQ